MAQFPVLDTNADDEVAKLVSTAGSLGLPAAAIESIITGCGGDVRRALEVSHMETVVLDGCVYRRCLSEVRWECQEVSEAQNRSNVPTPEKLGTAPLG